MHNAYHEVQLKLHPSKSHLRHRVTPILYALLVVCWRRSLTRLSTHGAEYVCTFNKHACAALRVTPSCYSMCSVCGQIVLPIPSKRIRGSATFHPASRSKYISCASCFCNSFSSSFISHRREVTLCRNSTLRPLPLLMRTFRLIQRC